MTGGAAAALLTDGRAGERPRLAGESLPTGRVTGIQRARMLAAMAEVCAELGLANVTVAHVVERSGVSRRTFYEQFADRDDCFRAAVEEALERASGYVLPAYRAPGRWRERVRAALVALLWFLEDEPYLGRLLVVETLGAGERVLARRQEVLSSVFAALDEGRGEARASASLPKLTAEAAVGGVMSILHARMIGGSVESSLHQLAGQLTSMVVLPYLGARAARQELLRPPPGKGVVRPPAPANPLRDLGMRLTYRTVSVLLSVAAHPGSSNRQVGLLADIQDQGQTSKLLTRLERLGLIENTGAGHARGAPNAWQLTDRGAAVQRAIAQQSPSGLPGA